MTTHIKFLEYEIILNKLIAKLEKNNKHLVIQIDKISHLFIKIREEYGKYITKIILILETGHIEKFSTINSLMVYLEIHNRDNKFISDFTNNLFFKLEEDILIEL
jgi:hypothetical protein